MRAWNVETELEEINMKQKRGKSLLTEYPWSSEIRGLLRETGDKAVCCFTQEARGSKTILDSAQPPGPSFLWTRVSHAQLDMVLGATLQGLGAR